MATYHECDRCGARVRPRDDLWVVEISPAKAYRIVADKRYTRRELCKKCRDAVYVKLMEQVA